MAAAGNAAASDAEPKQTIQAGPRVVELSVFDLEASITDGRMWFVE